MPNKILLIIKAQTFHEVKTAARQRGIHISDLCLASESSKDWFRARTDKKNLLPVQQWFLEPSECQEKTGFPLGTLLFFKQEE